MNHHHVYVVLLDPLVAEHQRVLRDNPRRNPEKPCVYVGMSGLRPERRFEKHLQGRKASKWVTCYGVKLLPQLYSHLNPMPFSMAQSVEVELAQYLRQAGYTVTGGH